jgi:hypothetical protein
VILYSVIQRSLFPNIRLTSKPADLSGDVGNGRQVISGLPRNRPPEARAARERPPAEAQSNSTDAASHGFRRDRIENDVLQRDYAIALPVGLKFCRQAHSATQMDRYHGEVASRRIADSCHARSIENLVIADSD